jgi:hypothetical protein
MRVVTVIDAIASKVCPLAMVFLEAENCQLTP